MWLLRGRVWPPAESFPVCWEMLLLAVVCLSFFVQIWDFGAPAFLIFFLNTVSFFYLFLTAPDLHCFCKAFLWLRGAGTAPGCSSHAPPFCGSSHRGAQAPGARTQELWPTGLAALCCVESSQTRGRTGVCCSDWQRLAGRLLSTREVLCVFL